MKKLPDKVQVPADRETPNCIICGEPLDLEKTKARHYPSLMFVCPVDGRHFRAFINHRPYIDEVLALVAAKSALSTNEDKTDAGATPPELSGDRREK